MKHVYGPVPSRRLGQSLGVDPILFKTCNYNCVYCQLGRTVPLTNERRDLFSPAEIMAEVEGALEQHRSAEIDFVTFVGQGEPLLCASLGQLIRAVKTLSSIPVAVITNGSLLFERGVREELYTADVVIPTLDAADEATFRAVNRAWPTLRLSRIVAGLEVFRQEFQGQLWVEVMLVRGLNDTEPVLRLLAEALNGIQPDRIQLNVPVRVPAEEWVEPADAEGLLRAMTILGEVAEVVAPVDGRFDLGAKSSLVDGVVNILRRHPLCQRELEETLRELAGESADEIIWALEKHELVQCRDYRGEVFWTYGEGRYGLESRRDSRPAPV
jgi:wyosine [tRNA(Phe)-imidazoG37] synthetase (radical SAM superfamily)